MLGKKPRKMDELIAANNSYRGGKFNGEGFGVV